MFGFTGMGNTGRTVLVNEPTEVSNQQTHSTSPELALRRKLKILSPNKSETFSALKKKCISHTNK